MPVAHSDRPVAFYKRLERSLGSFQLLACSHCDRSVNRFNDQGKEIRVRVCRGCGYALKKRPPVAKKNDEALLRKAQEQSEKIIRDIGRKMTSLKTHQRRVRYYTAKLEGRLKKSSPKTKKPIRTITVA